MAVEVARLVARLEADVRDFERDLRRAEKRLGGLEAATRKSARGFGDLVAGAKRFAAAAGIGFGLREGVRFMQGAIDKASDLNESINAVNVVFGDAAQTVLDFSSNTEDAVFVAETEMNELATVTGALLKGFGLDVQGAADQTLILGQRAADMASVFNTDVADALGAINASLRGEQEQIRRYGVNIDDAAAKAKALELGLVGANGEIGRSEKALASVNLIMEQTAAVAGDAANTADELANRQRALNERWEAAQVTLGQGLIPVMESLLGVLEDLVPIMEAAAPVIADFVVGVARGVSFLGNLGSSLVNFVQGVTDVLQVHKIGTGDYIADIQRNFEEAARAGENAFKDLRGDADKWGRETTQDVTQASTIQSERFEHLTQRIAWATGAQKAFNDETRMSAQRIAALEFGDPFIRFGGSFDPSAVDRIADAFGRAAATARDYAVRTAHAARSTEDLANAQLAATNPVLKAARALESAERAQEAYDEALENGKATTEELARLQLELGAAVLGANAALTELDTQEAAAAIGAFATALGITREEVIKLLTELGILTGTTWTVEARFPRFSGPSGFTEGPAEGGGAAPTVTIPRGLTRHQGGIVPGHLGQPMPILASGGEEVVPAQQRTSGGGGVHIGVLEMKGVWDFTDPTATRRAGEALRDELEALMTERY